MRIRLAALGRGLRRALPAALALVLAAPLSACRAELTAPDDPWPTASARLWQWQWQLSGELDTTIEAEVFVLDPVTTTSAQTAELRSRGRRLVCQVHVGSVAGADPDADRFPPAVRGAATGRRPGSRWLDVRSWDVLRPVLADRFRLCRGKRFGAVLLADADGHTRRTGFPIGFDDQLLYVRRLADLARSLDLSPGLLGNLTQVAALTSDLDFALDADCVRLGRCEKLLPFVDAGKPVFHVEYTGSTADFCATSVGYGFVSMRKNRALDAWRLPCP